MEEYLLSIGYKKMVFDTKEMRLKDYGDEILSTLGNLDFRYVKGNKTFIWGLHEFSKPPTLVSPRPKIEVKRLDEDGNICLLNESLDDSMNLVLSKYEPKEIYEAIDSGLCFKFDLT